MTFPNDETGFVTENRTTTRVVAKTVDVRDMVCAQALALTGQAVRRLAGGAVLEVICNASDVREDLLAWARECRHACLGEEAHGDETWLWIQKGR